MFVRPVRTLSPAGLWNSDSHTSASTPPFRQRIPRQPALTLQSRLTTKHTSILLIIQIATSPSPVHRSRSLRIQLPLTFIAVGHKRPSLLSLSGLPLLHRLHILHSLVLTSRTAPELASCAVGSHYIFHEAMSAAFALARVDSGRPGKCICSLGSVVQGCSVRCLPGLGRRQVDYCHCHSIQVEYIGRLRLAWYSHNLGCRKAPSALNRLLRISDWRGFLLCMNNALRKLPLRQL